MNRRPFRLKLYSTRKVLKTTRDRATMRFFGLHTSISTGPEFEDTFNLVERGVGESINYGTLTAYLLRRFGYPNSGWDDYKELTCYNLSTPLPDMYLRISPFVGNDTSISIMPMVAEDAYRSFELYERKPFMDYLARRRAWIESTSGRPDWADSCIAALRKDWGDAVDGFWTAFEHLAHYSHRKDKEPDGDSQNTIARVWVDWADEKRSAYAAIEPNPSPLYRTENIDAWSGDDPLKPYAQALLVALADLKTPVRVRDCAINAYGEADEGRVILREPAVAGYPCGAIGNEAPEEFAQLHGLIMKMGKGNARRGVNMVLKALGQSDITAHR